MTAPRFTFKKEKRETGLRSIGRPFPNTVIKLAGKAVGMIYAPTYPTKDDNWSVAFTVKRTPTAEDTCPFVWRKLTRLFDSEAVARKFVQLNVAACIAAGLYLMEDEEE